MSSRTAAELEERQSRVAKAVWGLLAIAMGVLFTLNNFGKLDLERKPFPARYAVDGDPETRWSSQFYEPQSLSIDLGAPATITRVTLNWEKAYAKDYRVDVSYDGKDWTTVARVKDGDGGVDELPVEATGRYVRLSATKRGTPFGVSLWEMEVFGTSGVLSLDRKAQASSLEGQGLWFMFWPVTLIGAGLPLILAPKDAGHFMGGVLLAGLGVYFQVRSLDLIPPIASHLVLPIALILFGVVLVLQSWQRAQRSNETGGVQ
jgi:hypothetical protein